MGENPYTDRERGLDYRCATIPEFSGGVARGGSRGVRSIRCLVFSFGLSQAFHRKSIKPVALKGKAANQPPGEASIEGVTLHYVRRYDDPSQWHLSRGEMCVLRRYRRLDGRERHPPGIPGEPGTLVRPALAEGFDNQILSIAKCFP